jgi:hypothetical protein
MEFTITVSIMIKLITCMKQKIKYSIDMKFKKSWEEEPLEL